uniref:Uncharacterized protein n=1 Tax=Aegilops tauschii subsp. strangulata TaxID=200361 RepID=A0A453IL95_AEGTS
MSSSDPSLATEAPQAAVTSERKLSPDLQEQLAKPCTYPLVSFVGRCSESEIQCFSPVLSRRFGQRGGPSERPAVAR